MANTFGAGGQSRAIHPFNLNAIADTSIKYFADRFHPFRAFTTDFSPEVAARGDSVTTRLAKAIVGKQLTNTTADASYQPSYDAYSPDDVSADAITVFVSEPQGVVFAFTEHELANAGNLMWLRDTFLEPAIEGLQQRIFSMCLPKMVEQNVITGSPGSATGAAATNAIADGTERNNSILDADDFTVDNLINLGTKLTNRKVPVAGRAIFCNPSYFGNLVKDDSLLHVYSGGTLKPIRERRVPRIAGFDVYEMRFLGSSSIQTKKYPAVTTNAGTSEVANTFQSTTIDKNVSAATNAAPSNTDITAAANRTVGAIVTHPACMAMVARMVPDPSSVGANAHGMYESRVEPSTGLPLQFRLWYDNSKGLYNISIGLSVGFEIGNPLGYERIVGSLSTDSASLPNQLNHGKVD